MKKVEFLSLIGEVVIDVDFYPEQFIKFTTNKEDVFVLRHVQKGSEYFYLDSISGDLDKLLGTITGIEETFTKNNYNLEQSKSELWFLETCLFYKFSTEKGSVIIKFYGLSSTMDFQKAELFLEEETDIN